MTIDKVTAVITLTKTLLPTAIPLQQVNATNEDGLRTMVQMEDRLENYTW